MSTNTIIAKRTGNSLFCLLLCLALLSACGRSEMRCTYKDNGGSLTLTRVEGVTGEELTLPDEVNGKMLTAIGSYAFYGHSELCRITFPQSITYIGEYAFYDCSLTSVVIPEKCEVFESSFPEACAVYFEKAQTSGGSSELAPHVHSWSPANCVRPATCTLCGATQGSALGHSWVAATAQQPRHCSVCGETDNEGYPTPTPDPTPTSAPPTELSSDGPVELFTYDESLTQVYSVSVAHSPSLSRCESCVRKLRKAGYNAYLFETPGKAGYTIQIGVFSSLADADAYAVFLQGQPEVSGVKLGSAYALKNVRLSSYAIRRYSVVQWDPASASAAPTQSTVQPSASCAFTYFIQSKEVTITGYTGTLPSALTLPERLEGCEVRAIGEGAFRNCGSLKSLVIPDTVMTLGKEAFKGCTSLETVTLSINVSLIPEACFSGCPIRKLENIFFVSEVGSRAFDAIRIESIILHYECCWALDAFPTGCSVSAMQSTSPEFVDNSIIQGEYYSFSIAENRWYKSKERSGQSLEFFPVDVYGDGIDELVTLKRGGPMDSGFYELYGALPSENKVVLITSGDCSADAYVLLEGGIHTLAISEYHTGYEYDILIRIENGVLTHSSYVEMDAEAGEALPGFFDTVKAVSLHTLNSN